MHAERQPDAGNRQQHTCGQQPIEALVAGNRGDGQSHQRKGREQQRTQTSLDMLEAEVEQRDQHPKLHDAEQRYANRIAGRQTRQRGARAADPGQQRQQRGQGDRVAQKGQ
jgi:hypothetical protein